MRWRTTLCFVVCWTGLGTPCAAETARFATFNASLSRNASGELLADLANPDAAGASPAAANRIQQIHNVAEILQRIDADVVLVNEFDFDSGGTPTASSTPTPLGQSSRAAELFQENFLAAAHGGGATGRTKTRPLNYPHRYTPNTNTGLASGHDLDNSGSVGGGGDAFGFGRFPGQYAMTVYSKYPITAVRTFQTFLWKGMLGNLLRDDPTKGPNNLSNYYSAEEIDVLRLSSKNHVDLVLDVNGQEVHFLIAHPTPPSFDGPEDKNGKRNHDEIRFWRDYIQGEAYICDDQGNTGGLPEGARFVIAGDYNADPIDGDSYDDAIRQLLDNPLVKATPAPASEGGVEAATWSGNNGPANENHGTEPRFDTADFNDAGTGNLRVDYVLPSANLPIESCGVFWPTSSDPNFPLVGTFGDAGLYAGFPSSDHRAVWIDVVIAP